MATAHWRTGHTVADLMGNPDADWGFHQLVRLLLPTDVTDDQLLAEIDRFIDFQASMAQDFPPGAIREVVPKDPEQLNDKTRVTCAGYNIAGLGGPLPAPFVDMMIDDLAFGQGAMNAFVNIFNNRIQALRYLIKALTDDTLASTLAAESRTGKFMLALSGHLSQAQRDLHGQSDDNLIGLAGDLANVRMSLPTVRKLFKVSMDLPLLKMNCLLGRWLNVQEADHTLLGQANNRLGGVATLGRKIWDQQAAFELEIGPISAERIQQLVPGGDEHQRLRQLIEWISDCRCDCKVTLICQQDTGSAVKLEGRKNNSNSLGFGSWLTGQRAEQKRTSFMLYLVR